MANLLCRAGFAGLFVAGCSAQSVPTVELITKPTFETFARLGSWRPWQSAQQEKPEPVPIVLSDAPTEASKPMSISPAQVKVTRAAPKPAPIVASAPKPAAPLAPRVVPAAVSEAPVKGGPAFVSCHTQNEPGQRVRMECTPVD
ncbi:hypothetical protein [Bosea sp. 2RAB26]|uniref:hypothetical protein n=1 Tax=Bosea sp. 2RAB26 TaxID=3237476 RepID=UPI003F939C21